MAKSDAVWGIDIGNSSLKALRCRPADEPNRIIADAFDFIEYPKILTQTGAEPAELVAEAIQQFLSRNNVRRDRVAVSVSGQNGLARFIKLPPVESRKIPDIVRYEARQQIPFDLDDVIWDYQRMGGGTEEEGFVLESEIGLFAMKRDQVFRALEPFDSAGIEVDIVQLTPLALYNFMVFDQMPDLPPPDEYDADSPPPSLVVLSMGTDASDLVVTNGFRVWQRSIPIGGNHFTKALTKELKLTFAKAEHLKRNAGTAEDPKAVFQAMRPVFNDLLTEVQRSIGFFNSLDRSAKVERVVAMGNPIKLPGLRRYLSQGLGIEVTRLEKFQNLIGPEVVGAPAFQENQLCFPVCYGLTLQGMKRSSLRTNLLPKEIVKDRLIGAKKPWAIAAAAVLLLGCTLSLASLSRALATVDPKRFEQADPAAKSAIDTAKKFQSKASEEDAEFKKLDEIGKHVVENVEGRLRWLELLKAIGECLPSDDPAHPLPEDFTLRMAMSNQVYLDKVDCHYMSDGFSTWFSSVKQFIPNQELRAMGYTPNPEEGTESSGASSESSDSSSSSTGSSSASSGSSGSETGSTADASSGDGEGPAGEGWLVEIQGHHYHNPQDPKLSNEIGEFFIRHTVLKNLRERKITMPNGEVVTLKDLGVICPVLVDPKFPYDEFVPDPLADPNAAGGTGAAKGPGGYPGAGGGYPGSGGMPKMPGGSMPGAMPKMPTMPAGGGMPKMPGGGYPGAGGYPGMQKMGGGMPGTGAMSGAQGQPEGMIQLRRFDFNIQFVWKPTTPRERLEKRKEAAAKAAADNPAGADGAAKPADAGTPATPAPGETAPATPPAADAGQGADPDATATPGQAAQNPGAPPAGVNPTTPAAPAPPPADAAAPGAPAPAGPAPATPTPGPGQTAPAAKSQP